MQWDMCSFPRTATTGYIVAAREMFTKGTNFAGIAGVRAERTGLWEGQPRCSGSEKIMGKWKRGLLKVVERWNVGGVQQCVLLASFRLNSGGTADERARARGVHVNEASTV